MKTFSDSIPAPPHRRRPVWGICFCGDETSPSSSLRSMPPLLSGEALAFRDVFRQTQIGFIENDTSLPRALLPGELSSGCETERLDKGRLSSERRTQVLLCTTSPTSSLRSMPPLLAGEALAFRNVFRQSQISFIENETSLPRAPTLGELARQRLRGQAR